MWESGLYITATLGPSLVSRGFLLNICNHPLYFLLLTLSGWLVVRQISALTALRLKAELLLPEDRPNPTILQILPRAHRSMARTCVRIYLSLLVVLQAHYFAVIFRNKLEVHQAIPLFCYYACVWALTRFQYGSVQVLQVVAMVLCTQWVRLDSNRQLGGVSNPLFLLLAQQYLLSIPKFLSASRTLALVLSTVISAAAAYSFVEIGWYVAITQLLPSSALLYNSAQDLGIETWRLMGISMLGLLFQSTWMNTEVLVITAAIPFTVLFYFLLPLVCTRTCKEWTNFLPLFLLLAGLLDLV